MRFEWDSRKAASNVRKHGITFEEASTVFQDPLHITYDDPDHSVSEQRFLTFGESLRGNHLVISHTEDDNDTLRIISARQMTTRELNQYAEG